MQFEISVKAFSLNAFSHIRTWLFYWQTGRWQQDIAYRDSLRHSHSLDRLKRLYIPAE